MHSNVAIIDLGTNTFHLLIATWDGECYRPVLRERIAVKIGAGGINRNVITDTGIERAIAAMKFFKSLIDKADVTYVSAFGTSAFRNANNGEAVARQIENASGIPVLIINGDEEAGYIFQGVSAALKLKEELSLVVDIGGGSVEFIIGNNKKVLWKQSFEIGAQRLLERFQKHDPILPEEISDLENYLSEVLIPLNAALKEFKPMVLAGSSGTFDTLSEIYSNKQNIPYSDTSPETFLTADSFYNTFSLLKTKDRNERLAIAGMIEMRVDMIVVACCLIEYLLKKHAFEKIRVSTWSLKEGVLNSLTDQQAPYP